MLKYNQFRIWINFHILNIFLVIYYSSDEIVFSVTQLKSDKLTLFTKTKRFSPSLT
uniref:Uncharacterized protein n=1 Tax=Myoviridae sp. ctIty1 TaxID=2827673 RepID=A0A8S5TGN1_9CAUD|nr:MAG TPA: hypothetical protein [Myoviridae sp. ctIty1]